MKRLIPVSAALALLLGGIAPAVVQAGTIAYDIQNYPAEQGGHTLSGLIITDGTIGALAPSDILSWTYTVDGSTTVSGGTGSAFIQGDVEASATQITLAQPLAPIIGHTTNELALAGLGWGRLTLASPPGMQANAYVFFNGSSDVWNAIPGDTLGGDPWVIAENPEPASLTLMSVGGAALVGYGWRRRRRTAT